MGFSSLNPSASKDNHSSETYVAFNSLYGIFLFEPYIGINKYYRVDDISFNSLYGIFLFEPYELSYALNQM